MSVAAVMLAAALEAATGRGPGGALTVRVDLAAGAVTSATDGAMAGAIAVGLDRAELPEASDVVVEVVPIGGREVVHVRVPSRGVGTSPRGRAWEAVLAAGEAKPLWAGVTGLVSGDEGERTGTTLQIAGEGPVRHVVVAEQREDLRLCGQEATALAPRVLDGKTLAWRGATMQRLSRDQRDGAREIVATARLGLADPPLARLLLATGTSAPTGRAGALTDGDAATAWSEARPGDGRGEFVVMRAPEEVPIVRLGITFAKGLAAPRTLFVVTEKATLAITLPEDASLHERGWYEVPLPSPIRSSCVALVLDEAYARGSAPEVGVAELVAYAELDGPGATLDVVASSLGVGGARAVAGAAVLRRAGPAALGAVERAWPALDAPARALAIDAAASSSDCAAATPLLVRAASHRARAGASDEVARKAEGHLARCARASAQALATLVRATPSAGAAERYYAAGMLARVAPDVAVAALAMAVGRGDDDERDAMRGALARAARGARPASVEAAFADAKDDAELWLDLLRALGPGPLSRAPAHTRMHALASDRDARRRFLALEPLASAAAAGDAAARTRLEAMLARDDRPPVRARAAALAAQAPSMVVPLAAAARDPEPRVREAALTALGVHGRATEPALAAAAAALRGDHWTFVRVAAARALGVLAAPTADAALAAAVADPSPLVRAPALEGLGVHRAAKHAGVVRARLDDVAEAASVRAAAARALGAMCARAATDTLTENARRLASPMTDADTGELARAALDALAKLAPADLAARLAPLRSATARPEVRRLAEAALAAARRGRCGGAAPE